MKRYLLDTFFSWIKLRLPDDLFIGLVDDCPNLLRLTYEELNDANFENVEIAAKCIVELLSLSRHIESFASIKNYVAANVHLLIAAANQAIAKSDCEKAEQLTKIFSELALSYMSQILESGSV